MQRQKELEVKAGGAESRLGEDRMKEMIYVGLLACHPECQGRGYGSALLETVLHLVSRLALRALFLSNLLVCKG